MDTCSRPECCVDDDCQDGYICEDQKCVEEGECDANRPCENANAICDLPDYNNCEWCDVDAKECKPEKLIEREESLEMEILKLLARSDASKYASQFARHKINTSNIKSLDEKQLRQICVHEAGTVQSILREIENFVAHEKKIGLTKTEFKKADEPKPALTQVSTPEKPGTSERVIPSPERVIPSPEEEVPSAPPVELTEDNECTICMDAVRNVVFLPCGHVCSCSKCAAKLAQCPICRAQIDQKVRIFTT